MATALPRHGSEGNLARELEAALDFDRDYVAKDAMKKRAIHTAASYDEFRQMVACARLTPVSSKELQSLKEGKKGWGRGAGVERNGVAPQGRKRRSKREGLAKGVPGTAPVNGMIFARDWRRRCATAEEKAQLLGLVGPGGLARLFKGDMDATLLGEVLQVLHGQFVEKAAETGEVGEEEESLGAWLEALAATGRFSLNAALLSDSERLQVADLVRNAEAHGTDADLLMAFRRDVGM